MLESLECVCRIADALMQKTEVVPGTRILPMGLRLPQKKRARLIESLQTQERDCFIQLRLLKRWVERQSLLKVLESQREFLLVHVCCAEIVKPRGFRFLVGFGLWDGAGSSRGTRAVLRSRARLGERGQDQNGQANSATERSGRNVMSPHCLRAANLFE